MPAKVCLLLLRSAKDGGMVERKRCKMKVLHLVKTSVGASWALRQMRELVKKGVEVHAAIPPDGPLIPHYNAAGIVVHPFQFDFPIRNLQKFPAFAKDLKRLVAQLKPDIIHSHFVGTTLTMRLSLGKRHSIPRIFQVPGPLHLENRPFRWGEIVTSGPRDYWIGSCQWTINRYIESGIAKNRVFLSYYGVDLKDFTLIEPTGKLRKELNIDSKTPLVGMVAYMYAPKRYLGQRRGIKGHEDLIDALAKCKQSVRGLKGIFVGGAWGNAGDYERSVYAYGKKKLEDAALFLGTRTDVTQLYPDLDIAVHPSHSENVGGACESLLMGIPTIATNVGGLPDVVIPGKTGWLVPPGNPERLSQAILEVLSSPSYAKGLALNGQQCVQKMMDVSKNALEILQIYEGILARA